MNTSKILISNVELKKLCFDQAFIEREQDIEQSGDFF